MPEAALVGSIDFRQQIPVPPGQPTPRGWFVKLLMFLTGAGMTAGPSSYSACATVTGACCKVCKKGKACGDSCISVDKTCHRGGACAYDE